MITSFTLPKTEQALTQLKQDIVDYYRQHQQDAHAIVDTNEPDEKKLLKLLGDILGVSADFTFAAPIEFMNVDQEIFKSWSSPLRIRRKVCPPKKGL